MADSNKMKFAVGGILSDDALYGPRPPLGVMPHGIWVEKRKMELARAISSYVAARIENKSLTLWIDELKDLVTRYP